MPGPLGLLPGVFPDVSGDGHPAAVTPPWGEGAAHTRWRGGYPDPCIRGEGVRKAASLDEVILEVDLASLPIMLRSRPQFTDPGKALSVTTVLPGAWPPAQQFSALPRRRGSAGSEPLGRPSSPSGKLLADGGRGLPAHLVAVPVAEEHPGKAGLCWHLDPLFQFCCRQRARGPRMPGGGKNGASRSHPALSSAGIRVSVPGGRRGANADQGHAVLSLHWKMVPPPGHLWAGCAPEPRAQEGAAPVAEWPGVVPQRKLRSPHVEDRGQGFSAAPLPLPRTHREDRGDTA